MVSNTQWHYLIHIPIWLENGELNQNWKNEQSKIIQTIERYSLTDKECPVIEARECKQGVSVTIFGKNRRLKDQTELQTGESF